MKKEMTNMSVRKADKKWFKEYAEKHNLKIYGVVQLAAEALRKLQKKK